MKRFLIIFISLALFTGFLAIKPPALGARNSTPVANTADPVATPSTSQAPLPSPANGKPAIGKPGVTGGDDEEDNGKKGKEKPSYGGHDDDDYDD
ncbi:MAG: hypothetical protein NTX10_03245 [Actinobacteria bacterium]|nr:hypothetical protein [Actinomycetota bacterium]